jgi:hypothetical protein
VAEEYALNMIERTYLKWLYIDLLTDGIELYLSYEGDIKAKYNNRRYWWWGEGVCAELAKYMLNKEGK